MLDSETQFKTEFSQRGLGPVYELISKFLDPKLADSLNARMTRITKNSKNQFAVAI
jgi:hypothetical protein